MEKKINVEYVKRMKRELQDMIFIIDNYEKEVLKIEFKQLEKTIDNVHDAFNVLNDIEMNGEE